MNKLSRRVFGKRLLAAGALPLLDFQVSKSQTGSHEGTIATPDAIAGYTLSGEEKELVSKFLATHEKNMSALRTTDLPNSLPPDFIFASPGPAEKTSSR